MNFGCNILKNSKFIAELKNKRELSSARNEEGTQNQSISCESVLWLLEGGALMFDNLQNRFSYQFGVRKIRFCPA